MKKQGTVRAKVLSITDGDTFKVRLRGYARSIRIACIDAPETWESGGQEAQDALTGMLKIGSKVRLREHSYDLYGSLVADVYDGGGKNVGMKLVKQGFAEVYDLCASQRNEGKLIRFEQEARKKRKGIWEIDDGEKSELGGKVDAGTPCNGKPISIEPEGEVPLFTGSN